MKLFEDDHEETKYPALDSFPIGTRLKAREEDWGNWMMPENSEIIFEIKGFAPSQVYPRDGVVLEQIAGPENDILISKDGDPNDEEYEPNASPVHAVANSEEETEDHWVAFVVV